MKLACVKRGAPPAQLWQGTRSALCDFSGIEYRLGGLPNSMRARRERLEQLAFQFPFRAQREANFLAFFPETGAAHAGERVRCSIPCARDARA